MKNLRNLMAAVTLAVVLVFGTMTANAGILISDFAGTVDDPCTEGPTKLDSGILMSDLTGIIVAGFTGIIVAGRDGIIVAGRDGIIVAGKGGNGQVNCGILMSD